MSSKSTKKGKSTQTVFTGSFATNTSCIIFYEDALVEVVNVMTKKHKHMYLELFWVCISLQSRKPCSAQTARQLQVLSVIESMSFACLDSLGVRTYTFIKDKVLSENSSSSSSSFSSPFLLFHSLYESTFSAIHIQFFFILTKFNLCII